MDLTLVILAAGLASRYGGDGLKQIDAVGPSGETLMEYGVYDAIRAGFTRVVFVIRPEIEAEIRARIARLPAGVHGESVFQSLEAVPSWFTVRSERRAPWGTGHATLAAAGVVRTPYVVINADDFYGRSAYEAMADHLRQTAGQTPPLFALVGYRLRDTLSEFGGVSRALCRFGPDGLVPSVTEVLGIARDGDRITGRTPEGQAAEMTGDELVSMNCWGFTPDAFPMLDARFAQFLRERGTHASAEFLISTAVNDLVAAGQARLRALPAQDRWCGMTSRQDRTDVTRRIAEFVRHGDYPARLFDR